jgi:hypothetical protein
MPHGLNAEVYLQLRQGMMALFVFEDSEDPVWALIETPDFEKVGEFMRGLDEGTWYPSRDGGTYFPSHYDMEEMLAEYRAIKAEADLNGDYVGPGWCRSVKSLEDWTSGCFCRIDAA